MHNCITVLTAIFLVYLGLQSALNLYKLQKQHFFRGEVSILMPNVQFPRTNSNVWHGNYYYCIRLMAWVSRHQKGKPFWILLEQEMIGWQWHQVDHMQIICASLQTDNHASTPPLRFLQARCPSCCPTNSIKALKVNYHCKLVKLSAGLALHRQHKFPVFTSHLQRFCRSNRSKYSLILTNSEWHLRFIQVAMPFSRTHTFPWSFPMFSPNPGHFLDPSLFAKETQHQKHYNRPASCCRRFFSSNSRPTTPEVFAVMPRLCSSVTSVVQLPTCSSDATSISSAELDSSATLGIYTRTELTLATYAKLCQLTANMVLSLC